MPVHCACSLNCKSRIIQILLTIEWHLQRSVVGTCTCSLNFTFCVFFDQTFHIGHFDKLVFLCSKPWPYSMFCKILNQILYGKVRGATRGQLQWRIVMVKVVSQKRWDFIEWMYHFWFYESMISYWYWCFIIQSNPFILNLLKPRKNLEIFNSLRDCE